MKELIAIQASLEAKKGQYNNFSKFYYRSCEDILAALKPLLSEHNAYILLRDDIVMVGDRIYVKATAELVAGDKTITATAYAREDEKKKGMDGSMITGAASSYARKYALNGMFAIDDSKDVDYTSKKKKPEDIPVEKWCTGVESFFEKKKTIEDLDKWLASKKKEISLLSEDDQHKVNVSIKEVKEAIAEGLDGDN